MRKVRIEESLFEKFPSFKRGIIMVKNIDNAKENVEIQKLLEKQIELRGKEDNLGHDFVREWDNVHRKFNSNPNKYPPSVKSLLKRVQKGNSIPFINSAVALFNYISLKYFIPCGGDDFDSIKGNAVLGFATGEEKFVAIGKEKTETPDKGEVIYYDDESLNVMCRKWNWRNGKFSIITENSKRIVINLDGVGPISEEYIKEARDEMVSLLRTFCGAEITVDLLNKEKMETIIPF